MGVAASSPSVVGAEEGEEGEGSARAGGFEEAEDGDDGGKEEGYREERAVKTLENLV